MSLLEPKNQAQRDQMNRVRNFGADEDFLKKNFKYDSINLALEAVDMIREIPSIEDGVNPAVEGKSKIREILSGTEGVATESISDELVDKIYAAGGGLDEEPEEITPWDVIEWLACEAVGIDDTEPEDITPDQREDFRDVLSQMTHAIGYLAQSEKGPEMALEAVNSEDDELLSRACTFVNDQMIFNGIDDEDLALEYVINAPMIGDADEHGDVAIEKTVEKWVKGKKTRVKKRTMRELSAGSRAKMARAARRSSRGRKMSKASKLLLSKTLKKRAKS